MELDENLGRRFVCSKCKSSGGITKRVATTGTGISKLLDIQHNKYIAISCRRCGYTEFYNPSILEEQSRLGDILDVIFN